MLIKSKIAFTEATIPNSGETLIYVFREYSSFASVHKFTIIYKDTVMGVLEPGTVCNFKVGNGEDEIVSYMSPSCLVHYRIQSRPGMTAFLFCKFGYAAGGL
jgi:hypothetical protein